MTASWVNVNYEWRSIRELNLITVIRSGLSNQRRWISTSSDWIIWIQPLLLSIQCTWKYRLRQACLAGRLKDSLLSWTLMSLQVCGYLLGVTVRGVISDCWSGDCKENVYFGSDCVSLLGKRSIAENIIISYGSITEVHEMLPKGHIFMVLKTK